MSLLADLWSWWLTVDAYWSMWVSGAFAGLAVWSWSTRRVFGGGIPRWFPLLVIVLMFVMVGLAVVQA